MTTLAFVCIAATAWTVASFYPEPRTLFIAALLSTLALGDVFYEWLQPKLWRWWRLRQIARARGWVFVDRLAKRDREAA